MEPNISRLLYIMVTQILHIELCHNSREKHHCAAAGVVNTALQNSLWDLSMRCRDRGQCSFPVCLNDGMGRRASVRLEDRRLGTYMHFFFS